MTEISIEQWLRNEAAQSMAMSRRYRLEKREEWQAELDQLTEKLAQKGATHSMRLIDVIVAPAEGSAQ